MFDYEGKEYSDNTEDYDFHFRKYDPELLMFTQPDSLIQNVYDPQLLNRYAFERRNPWKYVDESGHIAWIPVVLGVSALVGATLNVINYATTHDSWNWGDAAKYAGAGALSGIALVGGIMIGGAPGVAAAFAGGSIGRMIEDKADEIALEEDILSIIGSGALNVAGMYVSKIIPTSHLHKNIARMKSITSMFTTKSGIDYLAGAGTAGSIINLFNQYGRSLFNNPTPEMASGGSPSISSIGDSSGRGSATSVSEINGRTVVKGNYPDGRPFVRVIYS